MFRNIFTHLVSKLQDNNVLNSVESTTIFNCCTHYGFKHCVSVQMLHWKSHKCMHSQLGNKWSDLPAAPYIRGQTCMLFWNVSFHQEGWEHGTGRSSTGAHGGQQETLIFHHLHRLCFHLWCLKMFLKSFLNKKQSGLQCFKLTTKNTF